MTSGHGGKPEILYLVHRVPFPPDKGDRIRSFHILRFLSQRAAVSLACLADEPVTEDTANALRRYCRRLLIVPVEKRLRWLRALGSVLRGGSITEGAFSSPRLRASLRSWAAENHFHAIIASASSMAPYLRLDELKEVPAVVDLMDVDSEKWFDYAQARGGPRALVYRLEGRRLRRLEQQLPSRARGVTLVSDAEADLLRKFADPGAVHAIANGVNLSYFQATENTASQRCVFVGALDYYPNIDAALWFCRDIWPAIHRQRPASVLSLVGRRPTPAVRRLAEIPGVEVIADVPDVRPHLAAAAVAVVPLRLARGLQNKVLEALAMRKAVVASPPALAALKARPGRHLLAAASVAEWQEAVVRLLDDPVLRTTLGDAGRGFVEQHHAWESCLHPFADLLELPRAASPHPEEAVDCCR